MATTQLSNLINAEVMADIISGKVASKIVVTPFAKVDRTLEGKNAGDTITVPQFAYIGDAADVAEGAECDATQLTATTTKAKIKKAMKAVELTDEAVLSGYGDPVGETNMQLAKSIAAKVDADAMAALQTATLKYDGITSKISYNGIVDAVDIFEEEFNSEKVMFVHPKQVATIRKDKDFIAADKVAEKVVVTGAIGKICNCEIVPSKKVPENREKTGYVCPIVKLNEDGETENDAPALTIYMKRDANVEVERKSTARKTIISVDELYTVALSNASKVVLATFLK